DKNVLTGNKSRRKIDWAEPSLVPPSVKESQIRLGTPKILSFLSASNSKKGTTVIECHNNIVEGNTQRTKIIATNRGAPIWTDYLPYAVLLAATNEVFTVLAGEDGSLNVYSPNGRRLFPPIILESTAVMLRCTSSWLLCLTVTGLLYTWDIASLKCKLDGVSIAPILQAAILSETELHDAPRIKEIRMQKDGLPILITSLQQAFVYHTDMKVWMRISDAWYIISEFWGSGQFPSADEDHPLGWLASQIDTARGVDSLTRLMMDIANTDYHVASVVTIGQIETQLAVAALLNSPEEYSRWMTYYARKLAKESAKGKVEELCRWLIGPPFL
ncbi:TUP1-like enhancer of split-domain-containing protein, partial [Mycotypha africana]|uniref:TUP1-like enhancer of split-domain-containing protein n=1 Tax=Mycotypha africana TaxID=64632 RepID=UPI002300ACC5